MAERPILFSGPMVQAILADRKTQTRRVLKPIKNDDPGHAFERWPVYGDAGDGVWRKVGESSNPDYAAPYRVGDLLWGREVWTTEGLSEGVAYRATDAVPDHIGKVRWRLSIYMPRWASRITLRVTAVKVERLQDISEADAVAEGVGQDTDGWFDYEFPGTQCCTNAADSFRSLWSSINGPDSWEANPWVAAYTFERVKP